MSALSGIRVTRSSSPVISAAPGRPSTLAAWDKIRGPSPDAVILPCGQVRARGTRRRGTRRKSEARLAIATRLVEVTRSGGSR